MRIDMDLTPEEEQQLWNTVAKTWTRLGQTEPWWSVITSPEWKSECVTTTDATDAFYDTGRTDVRRFLDCVGRNDVSFPTQSVCAEFGCGVGRCTVWLAKNVSQVIAIDVSEPHLQLAKARVRREGLTNVEFLHLRELNQLQSLGPINLFFSIIVLQHNPPPLIRGILQRVFDKLDPGGMAFFQLPTFADNYSFNLKRYLDQPRHDGIEMHFFPQAEIFHIAEICNVRTLEVLPDASTGNPSYESYQFLMMKNQ